MDIFETEQPKRDVALFFIHGGGWTSGSRTIFHSIGLGFQKQGFEFATADYRLGGVTVFQQTQDILDALDLYAAHLIKQKRKPRIVLVGSSAGAHLALLAALRPKKKQVVYKIVGVCVQAAPFTFEPWEDIFPAIWHAMQTAVGESYELRPDLYHEASPINYVHASMPAIFAMQAENEHMFPMEITIKFQEEVGKLGARCECKVYPNTEHGFFYSLERWQQREALNDIREFVESL